MERLLRINWCDRGVMAGRLEQKAGVRMVDEVIRDPKGLSSEVDLFVAV